MKDHLPGINVGSKRDTEMGKLEYVLGIAYVLPIRLCNVTINSKFQPNSAQVETSKMISPKNIMNIHCKEEKKKKSLSSVLILLL